MPPIHWIILLGIAAAVVLSLLGVVLLIVLRVASRPDLDETRRREQ
jgi:hypothetical protein